MQPTNSLDKAAEKAEDAWLVHLNKKRGTPSRRIKRLTFLLNAVTYAAVAWGFFYPRPYKLCVGLLLTLPFIGLFVAVYFKGLVRLSEDKKRLYPNIGMVFIAPAASLVLHTVVLQANIVDWSPVWMPLISSSVFLAASAFCLMPETRKKVWVAFAVITIAPTYSTGAIFYINRIYDQTAPVVYRTKVVGKSDTHQKQFRMLTVSPLANGRIKDLAVSRQDYSHYRVGDDITVKLYEGRLGIPWFRID